MLGHHLSDLFSAVGHTTRGRLRARVAVSRSTSNTTGSGKGSSVVGEAFDDRRKIRFGHKTAQWRECAKRDFSISVWSRKLSRSSGRPSWADTSSVRAAAGHRCHPGRINHIGGLRRTPWNINANNIPHDLLALTVETLIVR